MEKPKKTHFDHVMERALTKARFLVDDLRFIRQLHKDGRDEVAYGFTLQLQGFYDDVLSGKIKYFSNLLPQD